MMKINKILTIILMLVLLTNISGQVKTYATLESGLTNWSHSMYVGSERDIKYSFYSENISFYSSILIGFSYKNFRLENTIDTYFDRDGSNAYNFTPLKAEYLFNFHYNLKNIQLGVKHECTHPLFSSFEDYNGFIYRASYNKLYFKIQLGNN